MRLAWIGRLLVLAVATFWLGGVVGTYFGTFPFLTPLQRHWLFDSSSEDTVANLVSGMTMLAVATLAGMAAFKHAQNRAGVVPVGGWSVLAGTLVVLGVADLFESHTPTLTTTSIRLGLAVAFLLAMAAFFIGGRQSREIRAILILGFAAWFISLCIDIAEFSLPGWELLNRLEETLEVAGVGCIGLGAVLAWRGDAWRWSRRRMAWFMAGSSACAALIIAYTVALPIRAPLVSTELEVSQGGRFAIDLHDEASIVQEFAMPAAPLNRLRLRLASRDVPDGAGRLTWRIIDGGLDGTVIRKSVTRVAERDYLGWHVVTIVPPLQAPNGQRLGLQLVADTPDGGTVRIGANKVSDLAGGRLWVNGERAWPDQHLEFAGDGANGFTLSKATALWILATSNARWTLMLATLAAGLTLITVIPALLLVALAARAPTRNSN